MFVPRSGIGRLRRAGRGPQAPARVEVAARRARRPSRRRRGRRPTPHVAGLLLGAERRAAPAGCAVTGTVQPQPLSAQLQRSGSNVSPHQKYGRPSVPRAAASHSSAAEAGRQTSHAQNASACSRLSPVAGWSASASAATVAGTSWPVACRNRPYAAFVTGQRPHPAAGRRAARRSRLPRPGSPTAYVPAGSSTSASRACATAASAPAYGLRAVSTSDSVSVVFQRLTASSERDEEDRRCPAPRRSARALGHPFIGAEAPAARRGPGRRGGRARGRRRAACRCRGPRSATVRVSDQIPFRPAARRRSSARREIAGDRRVLPAHVLRAPSTSDPSPRSSRATAPRRASSAPSSTARSRTPSPMPARNPVAVTIGDDRLGDLGNPRTDLAMLRAILHRDGRVADWLRTSGIDRGLAARVRRFPPWCRREAAPECW